MADTSVHSVALLTPRFARRHQFAYLMDAPVTSSPEAASLKQLRNYHKKGAYRHNVDFDDLEFEPPTPIKYDRISFSRKLWKVDVVITTPEMFTKSGSKDSWEMTNVEWQCLVVDEAHRLKNTKSR